ncbi:MAG: prenyltransferase [Chitinophagaceae bacterium]|nr:MAG: prenyltransferase [Chitinophagaceae bacterium]
MLLRSTVSLLRIPFSIFLSPVYFFALSEAPGPVLVNAVLVFFILHLLVYPASNGYNSYMDRDTGPIGGLEKPPPPSTQLYHVTIVLDLLAILLAFLVHPLFGCLMPLYIGASKAYSYRRIRLKQYPVTGYLLVIAVQGAFTFWLVWFGVASNPSYVLPWLPMLACAFLIGGFYPLTQVYQHAQDRQDGVTTISFLLGYRGTFIFCAIMYIIAWTILAFHFSGQGKMTSLWIFTLFLIPVVVRFFAWLGKVWKDPSAASFRNTMQMTWTASLATNLAFITLIIRNYFE